MTGIHYPYLLLILHLFVVLKLILLDRYYYMYDYLLDFGVTLSFG